MKPTGGGKLANLSASCHLLRVMRSSSLTSRVAMGVYQPFTSWIYRGTLRGSPPDHSSRKLGLFPLV
jgi:hypothetical protein